MQLFRKSVLLATATAAFLGLSGFSTAGDDAYDGMPVLEASHSLDEVPIPVVGGHLFASVPRDETNPSKDVCWAADDVLQSFVLDVENVGGDIVLITEGAQQEFADSWRGLINAERVEVSLVIAHVIPGPSGNQIVDVAEIGADGCALSRTLLSADDWLGLLELTRSIEV